VQGAPDLLGDFVGVSGGDGPGGDGVFNVGDEFTEAGRT
jgi:hypothetical protein